MGVGSLNGSRHKSLVMRKCNLLIIFSLQVLIIILLSLLSQRKRNVQLFGRTISRPGLVMYVDIFSYLHGKSLTADLRRYAISH